SPTALRGWAATAVLYVPDRSGRQTATADDANPTTASARAATATGCGQQTTSPGNSRWRHRNGRKEAAPPCTGRGRCESAGQTDAEWYERFGGGRQRYRAKGDGENACAVGPQ